MRILVTGSEGFIGSHLVEVLVSRGHHVVAFVQYNSEGSIGWLRDIGQSASSVEIAFGDIRDPATLTRAAQDADAVAHLAALISVPYSFQAPASFVSTNVMGTLNVLETSHAVGVPRTLVMSTSEVYGSAQTIPMSELHPFRAQSPYAASKVGADMLAISFALSREMDVVVARPFNNYGPRQSTRAVVANIVQQALAGRDHVQLGAVSPRRDLVYVTDTVDAIAHLLESRNVFRGDVFNISTGKSYSVQEVVDVIARIIGRRLDVDTDPRRVRPESAEVDHLLGDSTRLRAVIDWEPRVDLDAGLELTVKWWADQGTTEHPSV